MRTYLFKNVYINDYFSMIGKTEKNPVIKDKVDYVFNNYYYNNLSLEETESWFQDISIEGLLHKINKKQSNIDLLIAGDLNSQLFSSCFNAYNYDIPFLGVFSACASFFESLIIAACLIDKNFIKNSIITTSSHNLVNEKQFRYPIEYGAVRKKVNSFSTTGAVSGYLSKTEGNIKIESATIGKVINLNHKDPNDMGSAMAPAAADVLYEHLTSLKREIDYYDLILTGDLGVYGLEIMKEYCEREYKIKFKKINDAGVLYFNTKQNDEFAGASGPICLPIILFNKIIESKKYKKILVIATGSLHSVLSTNLNKGMPAIAHAISVEVK